VAGPGHGSASLQLLLHSPGQASPDRYRLRNIIEIISQWVYLLNKITFHSHYINYFNLISLHISNMSRLYAMTNVHKVPSGVPYEDVGDSAGVAKEGDNDEDMEVLCRFLS